MKTDNPEHVGKHAFELAGLGKAPFQFVGFSENVIKYPDGSTKAGGTCQYCFTGIRFECRIKSADGKTFVVGSDCVNKADDSGLLKAFKQSPSYRKHLRDLRHAREKVRREEFNSLLEANKGALSMVPHRKGFTDRQTGTPLTAYDDFAWWGRSYGNSNIHHLTKQLRAFVAKLPVLTGVAA